MKLEPLSKNKRIEIDWDYQQYIQNDKRIYTGLVAPILFNKKDIKSACEFWLEEKDHPVIFIAEHPAYEEELKKVLGKDWKSWWLMKNNIQTPQEVHTIKLKYNEWLFRLAFREVLE